MPMRLRKIVIVPGLLFAVMTLLQAEGAEQPKNAVPGDPYPEDFVYDTGIERCFDYAAPVWARLVPARLADDHSGI